MSAAADIFHQAAEQSAEDPRREGNVIVVESGTEMVVTGDLHGNRRNLDKIIRFSNLGGNPNRRLLLQEVIHGPFDAEGPDRSAELLLRAARLSCSHTGQVLFVLGNHDIAQLTGCEITKSGRGVCEAFTAGVGYAFEDEADEVMRGIEAFLRSIPLALRCPNGVFITHSLPHPRRMEIAGTEILRRAIREEDLIRGGPAYEWTWGRGQSEEQLDELADELGVEFFVLGHRHVESGWEMLTPRAVTIASDHSHGCVMRFDSDKAVNSESVPGLVTPIVALPVE
ncbi:MAG: metallophosphoesterase [Planctomycetota bacterium]